MFVLLTAYENTPKLSGLKQYVFDNLFQGKKFREYNGDGLSLLHNGWNFY